MMSGKYKQVTKNGFKTIAEAAFYRDKEVKEFDTTLSTNTNMTVGEYWKTFRERKVRSDSWAPNTIGVYDGAFNLYFLPHYANAKIKAITRIEYQKFIDYLLFDRKGPDDKTKPLSVRSVVTLNGCFQAMMNSAVYDEIITHNRLIRISIKKTEKPKRKDLSLEEFEQVIEHLKNHCASPARLAACYLPILGMRRGEIMGIRYGDIKQYRGGYLLNIHRSRTNKAPKGTHVKSAASYRTIFVNGEAARQLKIAVKEFIGIKQKLNQEIKPKDYIFINKNGHPYCVAYITEKYRHAGEKLGIPHLHPHMLRHTFATQSRLKGVDGKLVAQYLGHAHTEMTEYYTEPTIAGKVLVMEKMNEQFNSFLK